MYVCMYVCMVLLCNLAYITCLRTTYAGYDICVHHIRVCDKCIFRCTTWFIIYIYIFSIFLSLSLYIYLSIYLYLSLSVYICIYIHTYIYWV